MQSTRVRFQSLLCGWGREGDKETRRQGERQAAKPPCIFSLSPPLRVSLSVLQSLFYSVLFTVITAQTAPRAASAGSITGTIPPGKTLSKASAIDRESSKRYPGVVDAGKGQFVIDGLPKGTYDCILDF